MKSNPRPKAFIKYSYNSLYARGKSLSNVSVHTQHIMSIFVSGPRFYFYSKCAVHHVFFVHGFWA